VNTVKEGAAKINAKGVNLTKLKFIYKQHNLIRSMLKITLRHVSKI